MSAPNKVRPKVDLDATVGGLVRPGLGHGAEHLADCFSHNAKDELPSREFLTGFWTSRSTSAKIGSLWDAPSGSRRAA